jgi:HK97 family phage major capsid protein
MNASDRQEALELITKSAKKIQDEVSAWTKEAGTTLGEVKDRLLALEQKASTGVGADTDHREDIASFVTKSDNFKALMGGNGKSCRIDLPSGMLSAQKTAIVNATQNTLQPLVQGQRLPGIVYNHEQALFVRDLLPVGRTNSNLIEFTKENVFTNAAAPQYSSPARENVAKAESGITFTLATAPVITLAHFIPVSKQVLADAPQLQSYINTRLMYGLKLKEEAQVVDGDGTGGSLDGILKTGNFTAGTAAESGDNAADVLLRNIVDMLKANLIADAIVLSADAWLAVMLAKDAQGQYLVTNPGNGLQPTLWGKKLVPSNTLTGTEYIVGSFAMGAQLWDREEANVQISLEHSDNFTKNMATILAEERLALTVYRPAAFRHGSL